MAYLPGWNQNNRITINIDGSKIDSTLSNFPIRLHLGQAVGISQADLRKVFTELTITNVDDGFASLDGRWSLVGGASVVNNKLHTLVTSTSPSAGARSNFNISGEVDVQIDFDLLQHPSTNAWSHLLRLYNSEGAWLIIREYHSLYDGDDYRFGHWNINTQVWTDVATSGYRDDLSGKMRMTRDSSGLFRAYYWNGSSWTQIGNGGTFNNTAPCYISMESATIELLPTFEGNFDNFQRNSGTVVDINSLRKKIAVTTDDGTTQCYVEIEQWDNINQVAELWINVPSISSGSNTTMHLYYDNTHADNDTYVGDTGSTPAQLVWDSSYKAIYHMSQDPSGTAPQIKDSTANANNGTSNGSMTSGDLVNAKIGKGLDFDGSDDYIIMNNSPTLGAGSAATFSALIYCRTYPSVTDRILSKWQSSNLSYVLEIGPAGTVSLAYSTTGSNVIGGASIATLALNTWTEVTFINDGTNTYGFLNTVKSSAGSGGNFYAGTSNIEIAGSSLETDRDFDGLIDNLQISNIVRADAWIKATYYSNFDNLLLFGNYVQMERGTRGLNRGIYNGGLF